MGYASGDLGFSCYDEKLSFFIDEIMSRSRLVGSVVSKILDNPDDVDDAVQETLTAAWAGLDKLRCRDAAAGWLCTIAKNTAINMKRAADSRKTVSLSEFFSADSSDDRLCYSEAISSPAATPEDVFFMNFRMTQMLQAYRMLPPQYRRQLYLRYYLGMAPTEINLRLGIDETTRRCACSRAKRSMRNNYLSLMNEN